MRSFFIAGLLAVLIAVAAFAQAIAQQAPSQQNSGPQTIRPVPSPAGKPESSTGKPAAIGAPTTPSGKAAASTPESRSADPVFDDGTYLRIKQTLLSYSDVEVRGGWPSLPADAKLAPGASGSAVALLRRYLVITGDLAANAEAGDSYDETVTAAVKKFQLRHGVEPSGSVGAQIKKALNVPIKDRIKQLEASPGFDRTAIDAGIATGQTKIINLPHKIPVAWVYLTGWVTRDGTVEFREDIYKHDDQIDRAALDDAAAGGFVAPVSQTLPQTASQPPPSMPRRGPPPAVTQASNPDGR